MKDIDMSKKIYTIEEIKKILTKILKDLPVYQVILFGSYAKNEATPHSDLDFIVDTRNTLHGFDFLELAYIIEQTFKKNIDVFEKYDIIKNSKIDNEIKETGVVVYEK